MPLGIGLRGPDQRLSVIAGPEARRSPHYWHGPSVAADSPFDVRFVIHTGMGPGGFLCRGAGEASWSSLDAASAWGAERLEWPARWSIGHAARGAADQPFRGSDPHGIGAGLAMMREIGRDELEPLATGAWILGAGGGGNPYLSYVNLLSLYDGGARSR